MIPGGGVEQGETIAQAAGREGAEELGVGITPGPLRAIVHGQGNWPDGVLELPPA